MSKSSDPEPTSSEEAHIDLEAEVDQGGPYSHIDPLLRFAASVTAGSSAKHRPRLLDVCCGTGRLTRRFAEEGWDVIGVDASAEMIEAARVLHPKASSPGEFFVAADPLDVDLGDNYFDLIVAFDEIATELVDQSRLGRLLGMSTKWLAKGGHLIFQLPHADSGSSDETLGVIRRAGLDSAWRASPLRLEEPIDIEHGGSRDQFVCRRDQ